MGRRQTQRAAKRKLQAAANVENIAIMAGQVRHDAAKRADAGRTHGPQPRIETCLRQDEWRQAYEIIDDNSVAIKDARLLQIFNDIKKTTGEANLGKAVEVFRQELKAGDDQDEQEPEEPKGQCPHQPAEQILLSKGGKRKKIEAPGLRAHLSGVGREARG